MERDAHDPDEIGTVATAPAGDRIGRARIIGEEGPPAGEEGQPGGAIAALPEESSWSPQALALGVVALVIIVGTLLLVLWGAFQL